jgi:glycosyltransferase involved in cell wall biosynthesis
LNLTILTQYFPPEVGAPQNRLFELAVRMQQNGISVQVLTAMPNYPKMEIQDDYKGKWYSLEEMEEMHVHRSAIFVSKKSGIAVRLLNYFSFVFSSFWIGLFKLKKTDVILCESPPLFLGISAWLLCKIKGAKLVFNVSDLWPESAEKLGLVTNKFFLKLATYLEEFLYRSSALITGQTQGIVKNISDRFPNKKVVWIPNGVDPILFNQEIKNEQSWRTEMKLGENDFVLLYAGILGYAQGLDVITDAANQLKDRPDIKFVFLGNGPEKDRLQQIVTTESLTNVLFHDFVSKAAMPRILKEIDASIVPLKKLPLFLGAIPSKIFECLASEKPILLGVDGEARALFVDNGKAGLFFEPENSNDLVCQILVLKENPLLSEELGNNGKRYVSEHFNRGVIAAKLTKEINSLR